MSKSITAEDRAAIADVIARYGHAVDARDRDLLESTLADGFELVAGEFVFDRDTLYANILSTEPLPAHHVDTTAVESPVPGVARAWSKYIVIGDDARSGDYLDTLVHEDGRWLLWHRDVRRRYRVASDPEGSSQRPVTPEQWRQGPLPETVRGYPRDGDATDRLAISQTLHRYGWAVDNRRWEDWDDLFTSDAVIDFSSSFWGENTFGWGVHTPAEVRDLLTERSDPNRIDGQHLVLNSIIDFLGDGIAEVRSEFLAITLAHGADSTTAVRTSTGGRYEDRLQRGDDGRWRLAARTSHVRWQSNEEIALPENRRASAR